MDDLEAQGERARESDKIRVAIITTTATKKKE